MKDKHIIEVVDSVAFASLSQIELDEMKTHTRECAPCRSAFDAAQLSSLVIRERTQVTIEPSPFFHTKVLAALREQQQAADNTPAFVRLWKSASALVSSMAVVTMVLGVMTFVAPEPATAVEQTVSLDAAEAVIFDQGDEQLTYEQVLSTIYGEGDEAR